MPPKTIQWVGGLDGHVELIDQTLLPTELRILSIDSVEALWQAIRTLQVRGAPAIGVAAAMGAVLAVRDVPEGDEAGLFEKLDSACAYLAGCRPTAVNLTWALRRMRQKAESLRGEPTAAIKQALLAEAEAIRREDEATCRAIGAAGADLIRDGCGVLTHCNAGALATSAYGTALAVLYAAHEAGKRFRVFVDETRPLLQGSRLTAWELSQAGIETVVICDGAAAAVMRQGKVDLVITGADRIARNGDTANKIGTYSVAVAAKAHGIPFYVAAPTSTFDLTLADGDGIPIEERPAEEIRCGFGRVTAPEEAACYNPAFDVTPADLIRGIVTERGRIEPVTASKIAEFFGNGPCNGLETH